MRRTPLAIVIVITVTALPIVGGGAIPGADDPKAFTEHDYRRALLEFNTRTLSESHRTVGSRDPKWDAQSIAFLDATAKVFAYGDAAPQYNVLPDDATTELEELGKAARDAGCDDPLVKYCYGVSLSLLNRRPADYKPLLDESAEELYVSRYPINRSWAAANRQWSLAPAGDRKRREASWTRNRDLMLAMIATWQWKAIDRRIILDQVWNVLQGAGFERRKDFFDELAQQKNADAWVSNVLRGRHEIEMAQFAKARTHLKAAWELEPTFPEPAVDLIAVARADSPQPRVEIRTWFERAVGAQLDYEPAYTAYLHAMYPGWHGSHAAMYEFGRECAQTRRFDTRVPYQLINALEMIANDEKRPHFWQRAGVYEEVKEVLEGLAEREAKPPHADFYRSYLTAIAWRANHFDEARTRLEALGPRFQPRVFDWLSVMPALAVSHTYAMAPDTQPRVTLAEQQAAANQLDDAIKTYQDAVSDSPADGKALYYLRSRTKQLEWQRQFEAGEWVDIQPDKGLAGWSVRGGDWTVDDDGGLTGTYSPEGSLMLFCQAAFLGKDFIIEGNVEMPANASCDGGIGISLGKPSEYYAMALRQQRGGKTKTLVRDLATVVNDPVEILPKNRFRYTFAGGRLSAQINGKDIFKGADINDLFINPNTRLYIGVGGRMGQAGANVRFSSLRMKRVDAAQKE